ncbi:MAG: hypothetical protein ACREM3_08820 [Candidatus Rokuibacteriota bacterium]
MIIFAVATVIAATGPAQAILVLDSDSFGTAVHFNQQPLTCCSGGAAGIAAIQDGIASSSDIQVGAAKSSQATAIASTNVLELGIDVVDSSPTNGPNPAGGAIGASGIRVAGAASALVGGGSFQVTGGFSGGIGSGWILDVFISDFQGHLLASLDIGAQQVFDPVTQAVIGVKPTFFASFCPNALDPTGRCGRTDPNDALFGVAGFGDWTGSFALPFVFPNVADNGLIIEMWGIAATNSTSETRIDFLDTGRLAWAPDSGIVVQLATGQTFGAALPDGTPVAAPSTLLLLVAGLAAAGVTVFTVSVLRTATKQRK